MENWTQTSFILLEIVSVVQLDLQKQKFGFLFIAIIYFNLLRFKI